MVPWDMVTANIVPIGFADPTVMSSNNHATRLGD